MTVSHVHCPDIPQTTAAHTPLRAIQSSRDDYGAVSRSRPAGSMRLPNNWGNNSRMVVPPCGLDFLSSCCGGSPLAAEFCPSGVCTTVRRPQGLPETVEVSLSFFLSFFLSFVRAMGWPLGPTRAPPQPVLGFVESQNYTPHFPTELSCC